MIDTNTDELEEIQAMEEFNLSQDIDYPFDMYSASSDGGGGSGQKLPLFSTGFVKWTHPFPRSLWEYYKCKHVTIGVYETSTTPLCRIRKAITGNFTTCRVGTRDEDLFFVVNWAIGNKGRQTPLRLFFDCPSDFEKHCFVHVSDEIKKKWNKKIENLSKHSSI